VLRGTLFQGQGNYSAIDRENQAFLRPATAQNIHRDIVRTIWIAPVSYIRLPHALTVSET
jgi:hypothetical protein